MRWKTEDGKTPLDLINEINVIREKIRGRLELWEQTLTGQLISSKKYTFYDSSVQSLLCHSSHRAELEEILENNGTMEQWKGENLLLLTYSPINPAIKAVVLQFSLDVKTEKISDENDQRGEQMYEQLSLDCFISVSIKYQRNNIFNNLSLSVLSATFYLFNFLSSTI